MWGANNALIHQKSVDGIDRESVRDLHWNWAGIKTKGSQRCDNRYTCPPVCLPVSLYVCCPVFVSVCLSVYVPACTSVCVCPSVSQTNYLPLRLSVSVCLSFSVCSSVFLTSYLPACTSVCVCLSVFLTTCLCVSLSVCLYVNVCLKKRIIALEFSTCVGVFYLTFSTFILLILSAFNQDRRNRKTQSHFYRGCWFNCLWSKWWVLSWESLVTA